MTHHSKPATHRVRRASVASPLELTSLVESARVGADSLRSNPLRTVLATTGVIIGVGSLVAAFAITDGVEVWSRALIARESSVQDVAVTARTSLADFAGLRLAGGRFFTPAEETHGAPVIVLGHRTATELAGVHDPLWLVGRTIRAGEERREVLGVLEAPAGGDEPDLVAFAPLRGGQALLEPSAAPRVPTLRLKARSIEAVDTLQAQVVNWLAERYGRGVEKPDVVVGTERLRNTRQAMLLSKLLLGLLASLILAVGGIGIMNVLLATVVERTREIGIRKAVGASSRIRVQFLMESVTVTTVGSALGYAGGLVIAFAGTAVFRRITGAGIWPVVHVSTSLIAIGAAVVVGVAFGTYPARRAAILSPIEAITRE